jgi:hypothetical protein
VAYIKVVELVLELALSSYCRKSKQAIQPPSSHLDLTTVEEKRSTELESEFEARKGYQED